jgi:glycerate kinase
MKIIAAPNAFKGSLSAREAASAIARGLRRAAPRADVVELPVADGGDGTRDAIVAALAGDTHRVRVLDPLGRPISAEFGLVHAGRTGVVDVASASGLARLEPTERAPLRASSFGTGELIGHALRAGAERVLLGVGGSATVDGGLGLLSALGARFLDAEGVELAPSGAALRRLAAIDDSGLAATLGGREIVILADVDNPLCGPHGAAETFAAQKGASPSEQAELARGLANLGELLERHARCAVRSISGAGAAGGIPAALLALAGARVVSGIDFILDLLAFDERAVGAELVLTAEGRLDQQSLANKAPFGVARRAARLDIPTIALAGSVADDFDVTASPFSAALSIQRAALPLEAALEYAAAWLTDTSEQALRVYLSGRRERPSSSRAD